MTDASSTTSPLRARPAPEAAATVRLLNVPLLIGTLCAGALLAIGAYFWHGYQQRRIATAFLTRADELSQESNWRGAADYVFRYLQLRPDDVPARIRLARDYDRSVTSAGTRARAIDLYYQALGIAPNTERRELRRRLAELLLQQQRFVEAEKEAQLLIGTDPGDAGPRRSLALALWGQFQAGQLAGRRGSGPAVGEACEQAVAANPHDVELAGLWAAVLREQPNLLGEEQGKQFPDAAHRESQADRVMNQLVSANQNDAQAYLSRYLYRVRYQLPDAQPDLEAALRLGPDRPDVLLVAAAQSQQEALRGRQSGAPAEQVQQHFDAAEKYFRQVIDHVDPANPAAHLGLGDLLLARGQAEQAIGAWQAGLKRVGELHVGLNTRLAERFIAAGRLDEAEAALRRLDEAKAQLAAGWNEFTRARAGQSRDTLEAALLLKKSQPLKAIPLLKPITVSAFADAPERLPAWLMLGDAYATLGDWDQAATAFDNAARLDATRERPRMAAARAWLRADQPQQAVGHFEQALTRTDSIELSLQLARSWLAYQVTLPPQRRDWGTVERVLAQLSAGGARKGLSEPWRVELLQADYTLIRAQEKDAPERGIEQAVSSLNAAEKQYAEAAPLWPELALRYEQIGHAADADRALAQSQRLGDRLPATYLACSRVYVARQDYARAQQVLRDAMSKASASDRPTLQMALVQVNLEAGQIKEAEAELARLQQADPANLMATRQLAELALSTGQTAAARRWEDQLLELEGPEGTWWRYVRARRLLDGLTDPADPRFLEAAELQAELHRRRPSWPLVYVLKGSLDELQQHPEQAVEAYQTAIRLGERRIGVYERMCGLLYRLGRFADAEEHLMRLDQQIPSSGSLAPLAIAVASARQDVKHAESLAKRMVDSRPDDPMAWVWYSQVLMLDKQPEAAERAVRKAVELAPQDVRAWSGLFAFQLRSDQREAARETLQALAKQAQLGDAERAFVLAQGYELLGEDEQARAQYGTAVKAAPDSVAIAARWAGFLSRRDPSQAEAALVRLMELAGQRASTRALADSARRGLATLLAARGGEDDFEKATKLLQQTGDDQRVTELDQRLQAVLLVQRKNPDLARAQQLLEDLINNRRTGEDGDYLLLARVLTGQSQTLTGEERDAKVDAACKQYETLCTRPRPKPAHLVFYISFLLDHQRWAGADGVLQRLEELAGDDVRTVLLRARWLAKQDRRGEVVPLVEAAAQRLEKRAQDDPQRAQVYASIGGIYSLNDLPEAAEPWYRKALPLDPAAYRLLADSLARQGKTLEAIRLCLAEAQKPPSEPQAATRLATLVAQALVEGQTSDDDLRAAESLVANAATAHPREPELLLATANLFLLRRRNQEAVQLYRQVLRLSPKNVAAMNNLAVLLAEHKGETKDALRYVERAIQISGPHATLLDTKGMILVQDGRPDEATQLLKQAAGTENADPRFHFHLAVALQRVGQSEEARTAWEKALENNLNRRLLTESETGLLKELEQLLKEEP